MSWHRTVVLIVVKFATWPNASCKIGSSYIGRGLNWEKKAMRWEWLHPDKMKQAWSHTRVSSANICIWVISPDHLDTLWLKIIDLLSAKGWFWKEKVHFLFSNTITSRLLAKKGKAPKWVRALRKPELRQSQQKFCKFRQNRRLDFCLCCVDAMEGEVHRHATKNLYRATVRYLTGFHVELPISTT